jgi:hypothetical protein
VNGVTAAAALLPRPSAGVRSRDRPHAGQLAVAVVTDLIAPRSVPVPASALPRRSCTTLLDTAQAGVVAAAASSDPAERYVQAHLAALRAASAVLAARARPAGKHRGRSPSVWTLLTVVAPDLGEWAAFFAAGASKRAAAESGFAQTVSSREADDLLRDTQTFLGLVEARLAAIPGALGSTPGSVLPFSRDS